MRLSLLASGLVLALCAGASSAQIMGGPEPPRIDWEQRLGAQVPLATRVTDHDGRSITLKECFGERPVVLALVYYECPMLCDLVFEGLIESLRALDVRIPEEHLVAIDALVEPGTNA